MQPKRETLAKSIDAAIENGKHLLQDARLLFDWDRFATALALSVLAQEEFAKAFVLQLVMDDALPWLPEIHRSMARHQCKHLLAIVMEWLPPVDWDHLVEKDRQRRANHELKMAWLQRRLDRYKQGNFTQDPDDPEPLDVEVSFPPDVATALNIYRHEEIERLKEFGSPWKDADWATGKARKIADGSADRKKQSALYVHITKNGEVGLHPGLIKRGEAERAIQHAERLSELPDALSDEYKKLKHLLPLLFAHTVEEQKATS
jgi:AbiV family abortive infection protein